MKASLTRLQGLLPQRALCRLAGRLADSPRPWIKTPLIRGFRRLYAIDLSHFARPSVADYSSFNDFFSRELRPGSRPVDPAADSIVSPVDGRLSCSGPIEANSLLQAKGHYYRLEDLLVSEAAAESYRNGSYANLYLAPADYHRVHLPLAGGLTSLTYVPGRQFSVNPASTRHIPDIYARNERLIAEFRTDWGHYALVLVGALLVAGLSTVFTGRIQRRSQLASLPLPEGDRVFAKGADFAAFRMGSTAILLLPQGAAEWLPELEEGEHLVCGEVIGRLAGSVS